MRRLYFGLAVLSILPFWVVTYLPTVDGPCHTYNAWVLRNAGNDAHPLFPLYYELNLKPYPNWTGHLVLADLMYAVPPLVAEKILVSGYALLFLSGAWYLAGAVRPEERWPAFLAFPFVYNGMFQFGFYNFSLSLALFFFILGVWWRNRERPGLPLAMKLNLLLWLCYFSHILSFGLALISIAVLWLATLRRASWRRHLLHVPILLPQIVLPIWYFLRLGGGSIPSDASFQDMAKYLLRLGVLFTFDRPQLLLATALSGAILLLAVLTFLRRNREEADGFLLLSALFAVFYFVSPDATAGGSVLKPRLSLYPFLVLIPWIAPRFTPRLQRAAVAALAVLAALDIGYQTRWHRVLDGEIQEYLAGLEGVPPHARLLPLTFDKNGSSAVIPVLYHAASYAALEKSLVDWDNYEATIGYFPLRFRRSVPRIDVGLIETRAAGFPVKRYKRQVDYVYTWKMPPDLPLEDQLAVHYGAVWSENGGILWKRKKKDGSL
ncbi:MAG TPA: hypothetical protein VJ725_28345 [Thermoanaerobaculia bacterium]|nr:hypothetical protein [Thermoanaerobaculia bacterium]